MSLAAKVRVLEKRLADARVQARIDDAISVLIVRGDAVECIVTHSTEPGSARRRTISTRRLAGDTDESLTARHDFDKLAAARRKPPRSRP